jgi:hypothetical protein
MTASSIYSAAHSAFSKERFFLEMMPMSMAFFEIFFYGFSGIEIHVNEGGVIWR